MRALVLDVQEKLLFLCVQIKLSSMQNDDMTQPIQIFEGLYIGSNLSSNVIFYQYEIWFC